MSESIAVARGAADAANKSAKVAEDSLFVGERPYIFVTDARFREGLERETFDYDGPEVWLNVVYSLVNHGRTPAVVAEICAESLCAASLPDLPEYRGNRIYNQLRRVYPPGKAESAVFVFKTPIDGQLMSDIGLGPANGGRRLFAYGYVKYEDIFGYVNTMGFCWRYYLELKRFLPEEHPAYNYRKAEPLEPAPPSRSKSVSAKEPRVSASFTAELTKGADETRED